MNTRQLWLVALSCCAMSHTPLANAYLGPGLAAGTVAVILGLLGSLLVAGLAFFWYPIKRMLSGEPEHSDEDADQDVDVTTVEVEDKTQDSPEAK